MYSILDIKRLTGRTAAVVESFNQDRRVSFVESENLEEALKGIIAHGLNVVIPRGNEQIVIKTSPEDADFLEEIGRYLQLSFDFLCIYIKTEIPPQWIMQMKTSSEDISPFDHLGEWPFKEPKELVQFNIDTLFNTLAVQNSPNWV